MSITKQTALELYSSLGEGFSEEDLEELGREIGYRIKQDITPDHLTLIFIKDE